MSYPQDRPEETRRIDLEAADWLVRRDRGLSAAEQDSFFHWLAVDPRHGEWFAHHQQTWGDLNSLAQWRPEHSTEPNPDLLARPRKTRRWLRPAIALAAAAGFVLLLSLLRPPDGQPVAALATTRLGANTYESRVLDDGSVVELNHGAIVEPDFTPVQRRVRLLQGEALFTVARNSERPFIVRAGTVEVRAVGTAFNVRLQSDAVEVLVTEGSVHVGAESEAPQPANDGKADGAPAGIPAISGTLLTAGQRAVITLGTGVSPAPVIAAVSSAEIQHALAWQPKLLDFESTPLSAVVAEFNRYNRVQISIGDPALSAVPIVASFRSNNVDGFVRLLELSAGVRAVRTGETITLWRAR